QGVEVSRTRPYSLKAPDFATEVLQLNVALLEKAMEVEREIGAMDLVHAHDWLTAPAARALKHARRLPLIATIHATEAGRNYGLHTDLQRYISEVEWWLGYEAWRVICCSRYMKEEVRQIFQLPEDKIRVIPNGVEISNLKPAGELKRSDFAAPEEKIIFFVGRLVQEKGVQILLEAAKRVLSRHSQLKFIIGGDGSYRNDLQNLARQLGIAEKVYFTGYLDEVRRNAFYAWAEIAVFPSLYEPFGIVALEAMAAQTPVIVADTGGLGEIVTHGLDGLKFYAGSSLSLAQMLLWLLADRKRGQNLAEQAYRKVKEQYNWRQIARQTQKTYREVWEESQNGFASRLEKTNWRLPKNRNAH
ncbi:MAG: glycosyltransferase family 4 protein, partial [Clostridia bacterium]|nr:glycosyltransferase family 4 protein [Clostridia bacterium]